MRSLACACVAAALAVACVAIPVHGPNKVMSVVDDLETQALIVLQKTEGPSTFKNFLPLVNHVVVYTSAVLPSVKAGKEHKHMSELTEGVLVQTVNAIANPNSDLAELEKYLPTGEDMMTAMIAIGNVIGGSSGFNPIEMMANVVGKDEMAKVIEDIMKFPLRFPELSEGQLVNAEQVMLSIGLGFADQEVALGQFMNILNKEQKDMIDGLSKEIMEKLVNGMMTPSGEPTPALIEEIKREMRVMEKKKGNTDMMPEEFKQLVRESTNKVIDENVAPEALVAVQASAGDDGKLSQFLPLVNDVLVYTSAVLPTVKAKKEHKHMSELTGSVLVQTVAEAAGHKLASDAQLADADGMLEAMTAVGEVAGAVVGFNPIQMMTNLVGKAEMKNIVDEMMQFTVQFPEPSDEQMQAAEEVIVSTGFGFGDQQQAMRHFIASFTPKQKELITKLQTDVVEKLVMVMVTPEGKPTPALVQEIKNQMQDLERRTGSTDMMPPQFKDIVRQAAYDDVSKTVSVDEQAHLQALVSLKADKSSSAFQDFLPLINQAVVYTSAVLPSIKAKKEHKRMSELSEGLLVQTVAAASGDAKAETAAGDLEKYLPTAEDMLSAMVAIGNVIGGSSGFNPIQMMTNVVGKDEMAKVIDEIMKFPLRFPEPSDSQLDAAEQVALSIGLGFGNQEAAIGQFMAALSTEQKDMLNSLQKNVIEKVLNSMMTPSGEPTVALVEEIKREMREMEQKKGSTEMMPEEFKDLVRASGAAKSAEERAEVQALAAIHASSPQHFKDFLPLVSQVVVYAGAVLPGVRARKEHKHNSELDASMLVQTVAGAVGQEDAAMKDLEAHLPTAQDMLTAMVAIGNVMGGSSGFNPIKMMTNLVGQKGMEEVIDEIMKFPFRFPDLTENQLLAAEDVVLSAGLGFGNQEQALDGFMRSLSKDQTDLLDSMQKNVIGRLMNAMMTPEGEPSPALIEEIKSEMREMENKTGSTDMMPQEFKDLVSTGQQQ